MVNGFMTASKRRAMAAITRRANLRKARITTLAVRARRRIARR